MYHLSSFDFSDVSLFQWDVLSFWELLLGCMMVMVVMIIIISITTFTTIIMIGV